MVEALFAPAFFKAGFANAIEDKAVLEKKLMDYLARNNDVVIAVLYGSMASNQATAKSDVDLGILGPKIYTVEQLYEITSHLEQELQREIDLLDLRVTHGAILEEILCRGRILQLRDHEVYAQLILRMWYEREDDARYSKITLDERLKRWEQ